MENKIKYLFAITLVVLTGCYKEAVVTQDQVIVNMGHSPSTVPADGISKVLISLELSEETTDANNAVLFTTSKGLFDIIGKNTATVNAQNVTGTDGKNHKIAAINLVSTTDEMPAIVTATIKNYSRSDTINFDRAYPDQIRVTVDKLVYMPASNGEVVVTVQIKRNTGTGTPSVGQTINLSAVDQNDVVIGNFRNKNLAPDAAGICINYFSIPLPNTYFSTVKFRTSAPKDATGNLVKDSTIINIR